MRAMYAGWFRRLAPWVLLAIAVVAYYPRFIKGGEGGIQQLYPDAALCLLQNAVLWDCQDRFTYPPFFAFLMIPFALMPLWLRQAVWYLMTIGEIVAVFKIAETLGLRLIARCLSERELAWARAIAVLLSIKFVLAVLENQAYDAFVLLFIAAGAAALAVNRETSAGVSLAIATALKATPLVFLPYLLLKRRFVAAAAFLLALLLACYLPDMFFTPKGGEHGYFNTWLHEVAGAGLADNMPNPEHVFWGNGFANFSLRGVVMLAFDGLARATVDHNVYLVDIAFIAMVGLLLLISPRQDSLVGVDTSVLVIATLMLSPMTSRSHYVNLILPYTVLTIAWMGDRSTRLVGSVVLLLSFFLATATSNDLVGGTVTDWAYGHGLIVLGALVLYIYLGAIAVAQHRAAQVSPLRRLSDAASPLAPDSRAREADELKVS